MGIIRYGRTAQIGVYPGNQWGGYISYRGGGAGFPLDPDTQVAWQFAKDKTLTDSVRGLTLDFARASTATYVGADRLIKTALANEPRFDHDPVTGESLGLLIEEARTNKLLQSNAFEVAPWGSKVNATFADNAANGPLGPNTACEFRVTDTGGSSNSRLGQNSTMPGTGTYAHVLRVAPNGTDWIRIDLIGWPSSTINVYFNVATGQVGTVTGPALEARTRKISNGFYELIIIFDVVTLAGGNLIFLAADDGNATVPLDGVASVFMTMAQLEAGSFPTSYIPTTTASVTRAGDDCSTTDVSWYDPTAATLYAACLSGIVEKVSQGICNISDNSSSDYVGLSLLATQRGQAVIRAVNATEFSRIEGSISNNVTAKLAVAYQLDNANFSVNGAISVDDTALALPVGINRLDIGKSRAQADAARLHIREFGYANVRKDNTFLQQLTAP